MSPHLRDRESRDPDVYPGDVSMGLAHTECLCAYVVSVYVCMCVDDSAALEHGGEHTQELLAPSSPLGRAGTVHMGSGQL